MGVKFYVEIFVLYVNIILPFLIWNELYIQ